MQIGPWRCFIKSSFLDNLLYKTIKNLQLPQKSADVNSHVCSNTRAPDYSVHGCFHYKRMTGFENLINSHSFTHYVRVEALKDPVSLYFRNTNTIKAPLTEQTLGKEPVYLRWRASHHVVRRSKGSCFSL